MSAPPTTAEPLLHEDPVIFRRRWFLLAIMCTSLVMVVMSVAGLNVALPSIQKSLGATSSDLQWIVDAYSLVFAALLLPAGALGDRFGRKWALLVGLVIFASGSVVGGLAGGTGQVIGGRVITGIGAAFVMPATLSLLTTIFPPEERRKAIAVWAGFAGAGAALGPIVSGALLETSGGARHFSSTCRSSPPWLPRCGSLRPTRATRKLRRSTRSVPASRSSASAASFSASSRGRNGDG